MKIVVEVNPGVTLTLDSKNNALGGRLLELSSPAVALETLGLIMDALMSVRLLAEFSPESTDHMIYTDVITTICEGLGLDPAAVMQVESRIKFIQEDSSE